MPKMVKKGDLPTKVCAACGLPFAWRKKWARDWDQVKYWRPRTPAFFLLETLMFASDPLRA